MPATEVFAIKLLSATRHQTKPDEALRRQRNRFVGFAFAGGDLLMETDLDGRISYVTGAAKAISGHDEGDLRGSRLADLVVPGLADSVDRFLDDLKTKGGAPPCRMGFEGKGGRWLVMSGVVSGDNPDVLQLSFRFALETQIDDRPIMTPDVFKTALMDHIEPSDQASKLTMVSLKGLDGWSEEAATACRREIGRCIQGLSSADASAGWLDDGVLGVVQRDDVDVALLEQTVRTHSKILDPNGVGLTPKAASLSMDSSSLNRSDAGQALLYAINSFAETKGQDFHIGSLKDGFERMVQDTVERVVEVRETVENDNIELNFQPIVDLRSGATHHYEVLSRLKNGTSPFDLVCFAERVGLVADFDLMVCRHVIAKITARRKRGLPLAINLSARSMESVAFGQALIALLKKFPETRGQLMFELTESAAITNPEPVAALMDALRKASFKVCLDDFGSGAAAFHYLRAFAFDYVKIDGAYIRSTAQRDHGILKGMAALCAELGVIAVAEMIETKAQADRLRRLGVQLGQGYFFGHPMPKIR